MSITTPQVSFPNGHSVDQVKRNAKRYSKEQGLPFNKALDLLAREALGLPDIEIHWAEALKSLEVAAEVLAPRERSLSEIPPENVTVVTDNERAFFTKGIVVALDIKDASEFRDTGPWVEDDGFGMFLIPTLLSLSAHYGAEEDGYKIPKGSDWEWALESLHEKCLYRYAGEKKLSSIEEVIEDICKRNFFPPMFVWINGKLIPDPNEFSIS
jgi:hypothetical protein